MGRVQDEKPLVLDAESLPEWIDIARRIDEVIGEIYRVSNNMNVAALDAVLEVAETSTRLRTAAAEAKSLADQVAGATAALTAQFRHDTSNQSGDGA